MQISFCAEAAASLAAAADALKFVYQLNTTQRGRLQED
jgi:hypothetical protein